MLKISLLRYGNEYHQSVAYISRLSIMLGRAQSAKELYNIYIIIIEYFFVNIFTLLGR
jgi:hypothetical protein